MGMLLFLTIMATVILFVPGITAQKAKQSAWLVPLVSSLAGFFTLWLTWKLGQRFPQKTLPQYSTIILGKFLGKALSGAYVFFLLILNLLVVREFTDFLNDTLMPNTPNLVFMLAVMLVGGYGAYKGIEVIARMTQFVMPLFIFSLLALIGLALQCFNWGNLLPFLEGGMKPIVLASISPASWYGETVILVLLLPLVNKPLEVKSKGVFAILGVAVLLSLETLVTTAALGAELPGNLLFPFWYLARFIDIGNLGFRIETLIVILWITGIVTKVALIHYLICLTTAQTLGLKSYKGVVIPAGLILVLAAKYIVMNTLELSEFLGQVWPPFALVFELLFPLILLLTAKLRRKHGRGVAS